MRAKRTAFTLIELLVSLGVIGILMALLLPAIQSIRESARRTACQSNLAQIGIGLNAFHSTHEKFPVGCIEWRPHGNKKKRQLAWSAYLLAYIEQANIAASLNLKLPFDHASNSGAAAAIIPTYICPSGQRGARLVDGRGPCDYGGIIGERITGPNNPPKGMMLIDRPVRHRDVLDGSTNTIIVGEDSDWPDGQWINGRNIFDQAFAINAAPSFENDLRSGHPSGAVACFADGHVYFLSDRIDLQVLAAICTRAGREIVSVEF